MTRNAALLLLDYRAHRRGKADRAGIVAVEVYPDMVAISRSWALSVLIPAWVYATERGKMDINWTHAAPTVLAAFFASVVEFIEALTIVLAVGAVRGWRGPIGGAALALSQEGHDRGLAAGRARLVGTESLFL